MITDKPSAASASRKTLRRRRTKRTSILVLSGTAIFVSLAAIVASLYLMGLSSTFDAKAGKIATAFPDESTRPTVTPAANGSAPINVLLVGSDSRGASVPQAESGQASDQRSDTMMLVHIPADRKKVYVVSVMRDLWVPIAGHGNAKINAALAFGGVPLMVQTVEGFLGQRIDHVVFVNFDGFRGLTDTIGGVDVDVPVPFTSSYSDVPGLSYPKGSMHMDGRTAFWFVHERYAFPDGDYQRARNQQLYFKSLVAKIVKPETIANPITVSTIINEFSPYLTVDATLSSNAITSIAFELRDVRPNDLVTFTLPTNGTGWSPDGQSTVLPNQTAVSALARAMADGTMSQFVTENQLSDGK